MADPGRIRRIGPAPVHQDGRVNPDTHSGVADAYRSGFWGQLGNAVEEEAAGWQQATPDFDYKAHVPKGYEAYAEAFSQADNPQAIEVIRANIDDNIAVRRRREARGTLSTLGSDLVAGVLDPANVVPILRGTTRLGTFLKTGTAIGAASAAQEVVRGNLDPTATREETVTAAAMGFGLGAIVGGGLGALTHPRVNYAGTPDFERAVAITVHAESRGRRYDSSGRILTSPAGARGEMQVMPGTSRDPGFGIRPSNGTPDDDARVGREYLGKMLKRYSGDYSKAWAAYNWGPGNLDKAIRKHGGEWLTHAPAETKAYVSKNMAALGYGPGTAPYLTPGLPHETINALEGYDIPAELDLDGKGIPVVVGPLENGGLAAFVRAKSADEIVGEIAGGQARSVGVENFGDELNDQLLPGIENARLKDIDAIAVNEARRANTDRDYAARLGLADAEQRAVQVAEVKDRILAIRKERLIARTQRQVDDGTLPRGHGDRSPLYERGVDNERIQLAGIVDELRARADGLERSLRARGLNASSNDQLTALRERLAGFEEELRVAGGRTTPDIEAGELFVDGARIADEGDGFVERAVDNPADEELRLLAELDRRKREQDFDSGELADELPFGIDHDGSFAGAAMDGMHFRVDAAKILDLYDSKPWATPRVEGVEPFPEDAFQSPAEWLDFVIRHEREHAVNPRQEGEDLAAYENRINRRALDEIEADRLPGSVKQEKLRRLALWGSPIHSVMKLVPDTGAMIHDSIMKLASDMSIQTVGGVAGRAALKDGSVLQRVLRWRAKLGDIQATMRSAYLEELGQSGEGTRLDVGARALFNNLRPSTKSFNAFKEEVAAAQVGLNPAPTPAVARAASKLNEIAQAVEAEARTLGVFRQTRELKRDAAKASARARRWEQQAEQFRRNRMDDLADEALAEAEAMRAKAAELEAEAAKPVMKPGEERYYHRIYDVSKLKADREGAVQALEQAYLRQGERDARGAAERAYEALVMDPDGTFRAPGHAAALKQVDLPWLDREAFPYIVTDPELAFGIYLRKMGSEIEMTRTFGDAFALDHIDALREDLSARGVPRDKAEKALQYFEDARDHIVGGFHRRDPMAWDYRTARALKFAVNLAVLGKMIYSQVADVGRFIGVQGLGVNRLLTGEGPGGLIGALAGAFHGDISKFVPGGNARLAGEALELVNARLAALTIDSDAAVIAARDTKFERLLAKAQMPFFVANMSAPWTIALKEMAGLVGGSNIIDECKAVAKAIASGQDPEAEIVERLGHLSISREDAQIIAAMPTERGAMGLHLANVLAWEGERGAYARGKFLAAINGEIARSVPTPGVLDRPRIFDGVFYSKKGRDQALDEILALKARIGQETDPEARAAMRGELEQLRRGVGRAGRNHQPLLSLPFQLHSFAMAGGSKVLHGLFSNAERNKVGGFLSMLVAGMFVTWLKHHDPIGGATASSEHDVNKAYSWDKMTWGEFLSKSFEYSNLGAIFVDVVKNADLASSQWTGGMLPTNADQGSWDENEWASEIGAAAPAVGLVAALVEPFVRDQGTDRKAAAVRRALPLNNLIWWKGAIDRLQSVFDDSGSGQPSAPVAVQPLPGDLHPPIDDGWLEQLPDDGGAPWTPTAARAPATPSDPNYPLHMKPARKGRRSRSRRKAHAFPV